MSASFCSKNNLIRTKFPSAISPFEYHPAAIELQDVETHVGIVVFDEKTLGYKFPHRIARAIHRKIFDEEAVALLTCQPVQVEGAVLVFVEHVCNMNLRLEVVEEVGRCGDAVGCLDRGDLPTSETVANVIADVAGGEEKEGDKGY
jgi:hypothetical protein